MFKKSNEMAAPPAFQMESDRRPSSKGASVLGPTLTFRGGELSSDEDLIIEGTVEGKIAHQNHHLTIGKQDRVKANVRARLVTVYGTVEGDLHGDEGVHIAASARVIGNVTAPRVSLENGAQFQGSIVTKEASSTASRAAAVEPAVDKLLGSGAATGR
ncbi:MAG TPA: polymer-forming cytoskeletal protein [Gammaproteobacteria bacterium]|nr:polymer-forming cytoskeletal protein [Gammaproteobacteria bacterium]